MAQFWLNLTVQHHNDPLGLEEVNGEQAAVTTDHAREPAVSECHGGVPPVPTPSAQARREAGGRHQDELSRVGRPVVITPGDHHPIHTQTLLRRFGYGRCEMQRGPRRRTKEKDREPLEVLKGSGDTITVDNSGFESLRDVSRHGDKTICVMQDRYSRWVWGYPAPDRPIPTIVANMLRLIGAHGLVGLLYFGRAKEYIAAATQLGY